MLDWEVPTRYAIAIEYFKRAEATMTRNYVINESLTRAIKSNIIALNMLSNRAFVSSHHLTFFSLTFQDDRKISIEYTQGGPLYPTVSIR